MPDGTGGSPGDQLADRLIRLAVIVLCLKAVGFLVLAGSAAFRPVPARGLVVTLALGAAMLVAALGLLRSRRWAWPLAFAVLIADAVIVGGLLRLLLDVGVALVLFQPPVRARFGLR